MNFHPKLSCHRPELTYEIIIQNGNEQVYEQVLGRDKAQKKSFPFLTLQLALAMKWGAMGLCCKFASFKLLYAGQEMATA